MDNLEGLIERAQNQDKDAFEQIYKTFYQRIYRYILYNTQDAFLAQDLCQETFLKAWKSISSFSHRKGGSFQAFLFTIARNCIIDNSRKRKELPINQGFEVESLENLEEKAQTWDNEKLVSSALQRLGELEKQIIVLRYFEDLTMIEIAKILKIKEGTLRVKIHRVLKELKEILEKEL